MADVTDATFQTAVIERSRTVPVVVDLWAEWCGPCKQLGPMIEKAVSDTNGQVELAKVDVDSNPSVAQAFKVQSIPAVFAITDGRPVDQFIGVLPQAEIEAFVQKLVPTKALTEVEKLIAIGDEASLAEALTLEPANTDAILALAELMASDSRTEEALQLLTKVPESPTTRRIAALARTGPDVSGDMDGSLESLLGQVKHDDEARQRFVDLLELLSDDDSAKAEWRRRLTAQLF